MSTIPIPSGVLDPKLVDLGLLTGLLTKPDGKEFNLDWFENPLPYLEKIPSDDTDILKLLRDILGKPAAGTPTDREWYSVDWQGQPSGVYIVLPLKSNTTSPQTIGVGLWHPFTKGSDIEITGWVFFPLFNLPVSSPVVITGSANHPVTVTLSINDTKEKFQAGSVTFTGLEFVGNIYFSDTVPNFTLEFVNMQPPSGQSTAKTLADLQNATLADWVNAVLGTQTVAGWLATNIPSSNTQIGTVLTDLKLLVKNGAQYQLGPLTHFENETPAGIAEELVANALNALASNTQPVLKLGNGGIYVVKEAATNGGQDFGLRLQVEDIKLSGPSSNTEGNSSKTEGSKGDTSSDSTGSNQPEFVLQVGKWLTGESDSNNWAERADKNGKFDNTGISIFLININGNAFSFNPKVELISLGFDFEGGNDKPLFDISGVQLGGVELRFCLSLDFSDLSKILWGGALRMDRLGLPLGNGVTGSSGNPVAQNLLSSGSGESSGADTQPVNPAFSASVAWISDPFNSTSVNFQLYAPDDTPTDTLWIPVQRAFGPLQCQRLGIQWPQGNPDLLVSFLFDGDVILGGLDVDLKGLSIGIPLGSPGDLSKYELGLDGLDITFSGGPVEVSGGLFKAHVTVDGQDILEYNGEALIKAASWSISALGSWATLNGHPSLFIFAFLNAPIGGPAFFFVTGLSAGFGYNRSLTLPQQDEVQNFPFVAGLSDPSKIGGADAGPQEALQAIQDWVQPAQGVNWIAAGVQFTSFELINSNALVVIEFGKTFEIAILGLSRIKLPQVGSVTYAYVELGLEVIIDPTDGLFSATAVITPNSYVIDPACHLTGGFAFFVWFGENAHAGDFVLTIGGYHPQFNKPDWYPDEPRLGFNWQVSDQVTIKGGAYFALTPSCVMGGGSLQLQFEDGNLSAWFTAYADFLIQWKPFYYTADIGISIGVSYKLHLLFVTTTIKVELGADLTMWGPPTGGTVHVHLWVVSFTVNFGPSFGQGNDYLEFEDFKTLLPQDKPKQSQQKSMMKATAFAALAAEDDEPPFQNVIKMTINAGQFPQVTTDGRWLVRADEFTFTIETAWPLTELDLAGPSNTKTPLQPPQLNPPDKNAPVCPSPCPPRTDGYYVGVRPMGIICTDSVLTLTIKFEDGVVQDINGGWSWSLLTRDVPEATWGQPVPQDGTPAPAANTLPGRLMGLQKISPLQQQPSGPDPIPMSNLSYVPINENDENYLPIPQPPQTGAPQASATSLSTVASTLTDSSSQNAPASNRAKVFQALATFGYDAGTNGDLSALVSYVNLNYTAPVMLESPVGA